MKKILAILTAVFILISTFAVVSFAEDAAEFTASAYFSYENGEAYLIIEGTTPALYRQEINAMVYDPAFTEESGLETLKDEYGNLYSDVSAVRPLTDVANVLRVDGTYSSKGEFALKIPVSGIQNGQYMIVSVGGNGKNSARVSTLAYFETEDHLNTVTLPAFENATEDTIGSLLTEKQYLLGLDLGDDYNANKKKIHRLFVSVRNEDLETNEQTGRKINSTDDVINVYKSACILANLPDSPTADEVESFISKNGIYIDYDFSQENKDFTLMKNNYAEIVAATLKETPVASMTDVTTVITQSVGIAMLNSKDSDTIAPVVDKYGVILGIDPEDYEIYCEKYTAYEVNKGFVAKNFITPLQVVDALSDRIAYLKSENSSSGSGSSGGSGGSGGGGGGSLSGGKPSSYFDKVVTPAPEIIEEDDYTFSDVTDEHWANEAIVALCEKGVLNGFEDGTFCPDASVTREQFVKMIVTAFDIYYDNGIAGFDDVSEDRWSHQYILIAASAGIVNGVTEDEFKPGNEVSRQDAAVMLARLCEKKGIKLEGQVTSTDSAQIADYAKESVEKLKAANIISGFEDGSFKPLEVLTRAQAAKLIYGLISR